MDVATLLANLNNTIAGKESLLKSYEREVHIAAGVITKFLRINIDELIRIRDDVEKLEN